MNLYLKLYNVLIYSMDRLTSNTHDYDTRLSKILTTKKDINNNEYNLFINCLKEINNFINHDKSIDIKLKMNAQKTIHLLANDRNNNYDKLNKIKPPFNVNKAALFAASAAVKDSAWLNKEIKHVNNWNKKMFNEFKKMKIETNRSYSNFLLVNFDKVKINSSRVFKLLAKVGILVRKMDVYGIKNSLRITIGKSEENKKLISKMKQILNV